MLQVIHVQFSHVSLWPGQADDVTAGARCSAGDRLTVEERRRKPVCVTSATNKLVTTTNHATVRLVTDQLGHGLGFRAFYRARPYYTTIPYDIRLIM